MDSFYIEDNHSPIVTKEIWEQVQLEMKKRAEAKGNFKGSGKYRNRYPLSGMLFCSKCGAALRRRTWISKQSCRKIVWQCSNYIENGKDACAGTTIEDCVISSLNIQVPTVVKEVVKNGKKHYSYSSKGQQDQPCGRHRTAEKRMAAYCRVSTDQLEQLSSYEAQVNYYTSFIKSHPIMS